MHISAHTSAVQNLPSRNSAKTTPRMVVCLPLFYKIFFACLALKPPSLPSIWFNSAESLHNLNSRWACANCLGYGGDLASPSTICPSFFSPFSNPLSPSFSAYSLHFTLAFHLPISLPTPTPLLSTSLSAPPWPWHFTDFPSETSDLITGQEVGRGVKFSLWK